MGREIARGAGRNLFLKGFWRENLWRGKSPLKTHQNKCSVMICKHVMAFGLYSLFSPHPLPLPPLRAGSDECFFYCFTRYFKTLEFLLVKLEFLLYSPLLTHQNLGVLYLSFSVNMNYSSISLSQIYLISWPTKLKGLFHHIKILLLFFLPLVMGINLFFTFLLIDIYHFW